MMPFGKKVTIKDYQFTFGDKEKEYYVFACFKYHSEIFAIYADTINTDNKLYYGSAHITNDILVVLGTIDPKEIQGIQNFVVKLINNQNINEYEIISLDKVEKIEIIGTSEFNLKKDVIDKLIDMTIPKEDTKEEEVVLIKEDPAKKKIFMRYIMLILFAVLAVGGTYLYLNRETIFGSEKQVVCTKQLDNQYNASVNQTILFYFKNDVLTGYTMTNLYTFETDEDYQDFSLAGRYFHIFEEASSDMLTLVPNVENKTYQVGYTMSPLVDYFGPTEYSSVFDYYETDGYTCNSKEQE